MAFGPIITIPDDGREIVLAPFEREEVKEFISPGVRQLWVSKYLARHYSPTIDDEYEWFDRVRQHKDRLYWGIWVHEADSNNLVGVTELRDISYSHVNQAFSGVQISKPEYWGRGIASLAHRARIWYAFCQMGLHTIGSEVVSGNDASRKALEKVGYVYQYTRRNGNFIDGKLRHTDEFLVVNPIDRFWNDWWGDDEPTDDFLAARTKTKEILDWCDKYLVV